MISFFDPFAFRVLLIACEMFVLAVLYFAQNMAENRNMQKYRVLLVALIFVILGVFAFNYWELVTLFHKSAGWKF